MFKLKKVFSSVLSGTYHPIKIKIIVGLLSKKEERFSDVRSKLEKKLGPVDITSNIMAFYHTDYYKEELGPDLKRVFFSFRRLAEKKNLHAIKLYTGSIEKRFTANGRREINIDPGYISQSKLVLFSTKDYCHRIYLAKGIHAEVTLKYEKNTFTPWPWTFPDYKSQEYIDFFNGVRKRYNIQLKETL